MLEWVCGLGLKKKEKKNVGVGLLIGSEEERMKEVGMKKKERKK